MLPAPVQAVAGGRAFVRRHGYTLVQNLASHGAGQALQEEPPKIVPRPDRSERRTITGGVVLIIEPFLSMG